MKVQLEFMELILLQKINRNPGEINWDSHPTIDRLMKSGLVYFRISQRQPGFTKVYLTPLGKEILNNSLPFVMKAVSDDPRQIDIWN